MDCVESTCPPQQQLGVKRLACTSHQDEKLCNSHGRSRHLSTISLKNSYLFKIAESVISFCLKKISDSTILNKWKSFSGMVNHITCPPWGPYNFSIKTSCHHVQQKVHLIIRQGTIRCNRECTSASRTVAIQCSTTCVASSGEDSKGSYNKMELWSCRRLDRINSTLWTDD